MLTRIINLNCKEKEYDFDMSIISDDKWTQFIQDIVKARVGDDPNLKINGSKIVIRDNKAKVKLFYHDGSYHEVMLLIDEFGRSSKAYLDVISQIWQDVMSSYYGNKYNQMLAKKCNISIETAKD